MNSEVMIRLLFFILLFYLAPSSGLPPGTIPQHLNHPLKKLLSLSKPTITVTQSTHVETSKEDSTSSVKLINANSTDPEPFVPPSTNAITSTNGTTNTNDDITTSRNNHDLEASGATRNQENRKPRTSSRLSIPNFMAANEQQLISDSSHDHHYKNHHESKSTSADEHEDEDSDTVKAKVGNIRIPRSSSDKITATGVTEGERDERDSKGQVEEIGDMMGIPRRRTGTGTGTTSALVSMTQQHVEEQNPVALPLVQNYTTKVPLRGPCNATFRCAGDFVECSRGHCRCQDGYAPSHDERDVCRDLPIYNLDLPQTDPTMIGVIIGLILMSFTLCIVLRLFAKARFRENRTIFNTPNPRLMNVSLLKGGKQFLRGSSGGNPSRSRRGSQTSVQSAVEGEAHHNQSHNQHTVSPPNALSPTSPQNETQAQGMGGYPRPKTLRSQASTENETVSAASAGAGVSKVTKSKFRQDSVSSNV